ncbi:unnamed protein product [Rhizoctonia solani]|uniref:Glucose-methanol-choline oxidoreductase N-terminal domain-containing protein n=1 Tax=Rhizoctonia solani TaxID=456999 RepID=A0A8H2W838_9AGAM|nr:unnamed protein product [Rhizoctonia solani]
MKARKEVILSASVVHTPHILIDSGVGPFNELKKHNIHVVHDLPGTRPGESFSYFNDKLNNSVQAKLKRPNSTAQCMLMKSGPLTNNIGESAYFLRSDDPKLFPVLPPLDKDSSSGPNAPDLELIFMPFPFKKWVGTGSQRELNAYMPW